MSNRPCTLEGSWWTSILSKRKVAGFIETVEIYLSQRLAQGGLTRYWHCVNASVGTETTKLPVAVNAYVGVFCSEGMQSVVPPED